ncbi:hypothetical protein [Psychrilyobacter sp.]|uniref:hypothetical protein n=1 Tax=Psychrilyobacter sp. TaxID=2586924 RepID=UPI003017F60E
MKQFLLNMYDSHNLEEYLFHNWIIKDSLIVLGDKLGNIKSLFSVDKENKSHEKYKEIAKLDILSLVMNSNKSIIKKADSNNKYSFMFKKENLLNNENLFKEYSDSLLKKLNREVSPAIEKVIKKLVKEDQFREYKGEWIKIFIDGNLVEYKDERNIYVESLGTLAMFTNTENKKKMFLSKNSILPTKNVQLVSSEMLNKFMLLDKLFYMIFKMNKRNIYVNNEKIEFLSTLEAISLDDFTGFYLKVNQNQGNGFLEVFTSVSKKRPKTIRLNPVFPTKMNKKIDENSFFREIYHRFKIDIFDKISINVDFIMVQNAINNKGIKGQEVEFNSLNKSFKNLIEEHFFRLKLAEKEVKEQFNIFNTIYGGIKDMEKDISYTLGKVVRYLEGKKENGFGEYRTQFRNITFKVVQSSLESLITYHSHNVYACTNHEELKGDLRKIFNENVIIKVNNISLIRGYLEEITYYGEKNDSSPQKEN